jgi:hypothetical protein
VSPRSLFSFVSIPPLARNWFDQREHRNGIPSAAPGVFPIAQRQRAGSAIVAQGDHPAALEDVVNRLTIGSKKG